MEKENKERRIDERYMKMAFIWAQNSYAVRRKVGCLIVKDNSIISDGYNGTPSGFENVCEEFPEDFEKYFEGMKPSYYRNFLIPEEMLRMYLKTYQNKGGTLKTKPYVLHAESNAITKLARSNNNSSGATLYVTDEPCINCAKLIIQSGIKRVVFCRPYRLHDGIELLVRAGIDVSQISFSEDTLSKLQE